MSVLYVSKLPIRCFDLVILFRTLIIFLLLRKELFWKKTCATIDIAHRDAIAFHLRVSFWSWEARRERHRKLTVIAFNVTRARTDQSQLLEVTESRGRRRNQLVSGFVVLELRPIYSRHRENFNRMPRSIHIVARTSNFSLTRASRCFVGFLSTPEDTLINTTTRNRGLKSNQRN